MKVVGLTFAAATAVLLSTSAWSQDPDVSADAVTNAPPPNPAAGTPYANIVERNMFGLVPIPPPDPHAGEPPPDPPPKITPTGIMTIFGRDQALFTAAGKPKPGQPNKDEAYVLAEGERQDDIEVVKINHETSIITFKNHGTVHEVPPLAATGGGGPESGPGGGPGMGGRPGVPGMNPRNFGRGGMDGGGLAAGGGAPGNRSMGGMNGGGLGGGGNTGSSIGQASFNGGNSLNSGSTANNPQSEAAIEDQVMNAARQMALIEQNRIDTEEDVKQGVMPPLPPTLLTPPDAVGNGGSPLVTPPPIP